MFGLIHQVALVHCSVCRYCIGLMFGLIHQVALVHCGLCRKLISVYFTIRNNTKYTQQITKDEEETFIATKTIIHRMYNNFKTLKATDTNVFISNYREAFIFINHTAVSV